MTPSNEGLKIATLVYMRRTWDKTILWKLNMETKNAKSIVFSRDSDREHLCCYMFDERNGNSGARMVLGRAGNNYRECLTKLKFRRKIEGVEND